MPKKKVEPQKPRKTSVKMTTIPGYKRVNTNLIKPYANNSRKHSDEQIEQIVNSISEFGFTNPLIIDKDFNLIAGHARLEAAKKLDITEAPCILLEDLSDEQKRAYVIADNKLALNSEWDMGKLIEELSFIQDSDFDISLTGFSEDEIDALLLPPIEPIDDVDTMPETPAETRVKLGDLWQLGEHYLLCGDSTITTDVDRLMEFGNPNIMITDPPYGVKLDMSWRDEAKPDGSKNNKNLVLNDDIADWYDTYALFPGAIAYVWHASSFTDVVMDGLRRAGFDIKQQIIWNKPVFALGRSHYHWKHEPCWYAVRKDCTGSWEGDRKQTTVWDIDVPNQSANKSADDKTEHPTQKPVEVYTRPIENHTKRGDYIYDPFGGSGTAIIAAQKTNRKALVIELDPKYCDLILHRWESVTHGQAKRQS